MYSPNNKKFYLKKNNVECFILRKIIFQRDYNCFLKCDFNFFLKKKNFFFFKSSIGAFCLNVPFGIYYFLFSCISLKKEENIFSLSFLKKRAFFKKKRNIFIKDSSTFDRNRNTQRKKIFFFINSFNSFSQKKKLKNKKKNFSLFFSYFYKISSFLLSGLYKKIKIKGFGRRVSKRRTFLYFRVGYSFTIRKTVPRCFFLKVTKKKTLLKIFSNDRASLITFSKKIISLKPTNPYKDVGLRFFEKKPLLRKKRISSS